MRLAAQLVRIGVARKAGSLDEPAELVTMASMPAAILLPYRLRGFSI